MRLPSCCLLLTIVAACSTHDATSRERTGTTTSALTTVASTSYAWNRVTMEPARLVAQAVYDEAHRRVVLFGGANARVQALDDTWLWDGTSWTEAHPAHRPPPRRLQQSVYDRAHGYVLMFGGQSGTSDLYGDTWTWDGTDWTELHPPASYGVSVNSGVTFDAAHGYVLVFGGADLATGLGLNRTLRWDGSTWSALAPATRPSGREGVTLAYDPASARVIAFGGIVAATRTIFAETWAWNGSTWTQLGGTQPPARYVGAMAAGATGPITLFGGIASDGTTLLGDTWSFSGAAWTQLTPAAAPSGRVVGAFAWDTTDNRGILFGGVDGSYQRDTWRWDGATWSNVSPNPAPASDTVLVYDEAANHVLLFGGVSGASTLADTWTWDGTWHRYGGAKPLARASAGAAYDRERGNVVVFGGNNGAALLGDTWTWDGAWHLAAPAQRPSARTNPAFFYDEAKKLTYLLGGRSVSAPANDMWSWNGSNWSAVTAATMPTPRLDSLVAYDRKRSRAVLFGGRTPEGRVLDDTWTWDGATWTQATPTASPSPRFYAKATYDDSTEQVVIFGGTDATGLFSDTWTWNGTTWSQAAVTAAPAARLRGSLTYDGTRSNGGLLLFGGDNNNGALDDAWSGYALGRSCSTSAECAGASCTDGVCCREAACGACQTCAGVSLGRCSAVLNAEDPDTCSDASGKRCDAYGQCKAKRGSSAASAADCSTGYLVDGVCCETASCPACQTCDAAQKTVSEYPGQCGPARAGTDLHDDCSTDVATSCGHSGACDGRGACGLYAPGVSCGASTCNGNRAAGLVCNGGGTCGDNPDGIECAPYFCQNGSCGTTCANDSQCLSTHRCEAGRCVSRAGPACDGSHTVKIPEGGEIDCTPFGCEGASCKTACTRVSDCVFPAQCNSQGKCVAFERAGSGDSGCNIHASPAPGAASGGALALGCVLAARAMRRRSRAPLRGRRAS